MIVEYKLHKVKARSDSKKTPIWIDDGGYWYNPADNTYVGYIRDDVEYYVPNSLTVFTQDTFRARLLAMHAASPFTKGVEEPDNLESEPENMTDAEVTTLADEWWASKN